MFKIAIGHSEDPDTLSAANELIKQCKIALENQPPQAGLIFASVSYDFPTLLNEIKKAYPDVQLVGCSSYGEISSLLGASEDSAALLLIASDQLEIQGGLTQNIASEETKSTVVQAFDKLSKQIAKKPAFCCVFADGLHGNVTEVIEGIKQSYGKFFPIAGGNACDDWMYETVYQFYNQNVATEAASYLLFSEPIKSSMAVFHGREPFPSLKKSFVTHSKGNVVYTIDHMTAIEFYRSQIGVQLENYIQGKTIPHALMISTKDPNKYLIRNPFRVNAEEGSLAFAGDIPENAVVSVSKLSSPEATLKAAEICVDKALSEFPGQKIGLALVFSCALRREILGSDTSKEIDIIRNKLPQGTPIFGFYTYGEIGKYDNQDESHYQNETIVIALLGE